VIVGVVVVDIIKKFTGHFLASALILFFQY
jgi:hypothetical protein